MGRKFLFDEKHALHVAGLACSLFDRLVRTHGMGPAEKRILTAAAILHDIGGVVSLKSHHKHSMYLIVRSELPGFSARELFMVGCVARYHRKAPPSPAHRELSQLSPADRHRVRTLAAMLRIADAMDKEHGQRIRLARVDIQEEEVRVVVDCPEDILLEQWAMKKKDDLFREVFGAKVSLCRTSEADRV